MNRLVPRGRARLVAAAGAAVVVILVTAGLVLTLRGGTVLHWGDGSAAENGAGGEPNDAARLGDDRQPAKPPLPTGGARTLGERIDIAGLQATAYAYRQPAAGGKDPAPGYGWAALDVEVCARGGTVPGSWQPWSLIYANGATAVTRKPDAGAGEAPAFPNDGRNIGSGRCVRGWIMFAAPKGERPTLVELQPTDGAANWIVPSG